MKKKASFSEIINSSSPVLIDFSAEWCGPCKAMGPILKEVAQKIGDEARILKIDIDRNQVLAQRLQIKGVPTFILYKEGQTLWRHSGMASKHDLIQIIRKNL